MPPPQPSVRETDRVRLVPCNASIGAGNGLASPFPVWEVQPAEKTLCYCCQQAGLGSCSRFLQVSWVCLPCCDSFGFVQVVPYSAQISYGLNVGN